MNTFEYDGKIWIRHNPNDACPVAADIIVCVLFASGNSYKDKSTKFDWNKIIGYRIPEAEPQDETTELRESIAELKEANAVLQSQVDNADVNLEQIKLVYEKQLATALTPRPIAEAGPVKEGFVRLYGQLTKYHPFMSYKVNFDTHFIDIKLPSPDLRTEYDRAVAEAGGPFEAWLQAKGGVK